MKFLFFDTETTGVPKRYDAKMHDVENWPRVIQLAWHVSDEKGEMVAQDVTLIQPDGWVVPKLQFWIEHGFSTEKCVANGIPIGMALARFGEAYNWCDYLVAHNINFDYNVLGAEMIRAGYKTGKQLKRICTMMATIDFCSLPGKYGHKYPKLEELHNKLFGEGFEGAHDALADVLACKKCFFELLQMQIIKI